MKPKKEKGKNKKKKSNEIYINLIKKLKIIKKKKK